MSCRIFISYRRNDDAGYVQSLYDCLARAFTPEHVFMDVAAQHIQPGEIFPIALHRHVVQCDVLLAVIGQRWIGNWSGAVVPSEDFVFQEIRAALDLGKRVIPVLIGGATMPEEARLPLELRPLAKRMAAALQPGARFGEDCEKLRVSLADYLEHGESSYQTTQRHDSAVRASTPVMHTERASGALNATGASVLLRTLAQEEEPRSHRPATPPRSPQPLPSALVPKPLEASASVPPQASGAARWWRSGWGGGLFLGFALGMGATALRVTCSQTAHSGRRSPAESRESPSTAAAPQHPHGPDPSPASDPQMRDRTTSSPFPAPPPPANSTPPEPRPRGPAKTRAPPPKVRARPKPRPGSRPPASIPRESTPGPRPSTPDSGRPPKGGPDPAPTRTVTTPTSVRTLPSKVVAADAGLPSQPVAPLQPRPTTQPAHPDRRLTPLMEPGKT